jgi:hypothetical protein
MEFGVSAVDFVQVSEMLLWDVGCTDNHVRRHASISSMSLCLNV